MPEGEAVTREAMPLWPQEHSTRQHCGRGWHWPCVPEPLRLSRILLWVNPTTPVLFCCKILL